MILYISSRILKAYNQLKTNIREYLSGTLFYDVFKGMSSVLNKSFIRKYTKTLLCKPEDISTKISKITDVNFLTIRNLVYYHYI